MAKDALAVIDHLGWQKAHIFAHLMGKRDDSSQVPNRVSSLLVINVFGGGFHILPKIEQICRYLLNCDKAERTEYMIRIPPQRNYRKSAAADEPLTHKYAGTCWIGAGRCRGLSFRLSELHNNVGLFVDVSSGKGWLYTCMNID